MTVPGMESEPTSGTTISVPVKAHLSPACATSTASARNTTYHIAFFDNNDFWGIVSLRINTSTIETVATGRCATLTSRLRGILPRGNSACVSWIRTFWKSTNVDLLTSSWKRALLAQTGLRQMLGWKRVKAQSTAAQTTVALGSVIILCNGAMFHTWCSQTIA